MSNEEETAGPLKRIPVLAAVRASYSFVFANKRLLPAVLVQPALVYFLLSFLLGVVGFADVLEGARAPGSFSLSIAVLGLSLLLMLPSAMLFVTWHRFILLGENGGQPRPFYPLRNVHWKYFGYMVAGLIAVVVSVFVGVFTLALVLAFLTSLFGGLATIFYFVLLALTPVGYLVLYAKLSFLFPAIAVGERYGVAETWEHTSGFVWPLSIGFILATLPGWIIVILLSLMFSGFIAAHDGVPLWLEIINLFVTTYCSLVGATFVTFVFKYVTGWVPANDSNEVAET